MRTPRALDDIDAAWTEAALGEAHPDARISSVAVTQITDDVGLVGQVFRIVPDYSSPEGSGPASLILKLPTTDEMIFGFASGMGMYERECRFYEAIAPTVEIPVPRVVYNVCKPDDREYCLLMEEVPVGHRVSQVDGASIEQAREIIGTIARFHASWFDHPDIATWSWLPTPGNAVNKTIAPRFAGSWPTFQERYGAVVPPGTARWVEDFAPRMDAWLDSVDRGPYTVVHGDFRLDNMLWDVDERFTLLDWQIVQAGFGMYDVAYFLATNMGVDDRRAAETELLGLWRDTMLAHGADPGSADDVHLRYRETILFWTTAVTCAVADFGSSEDGRRLLDLLIDRAFTAAADHQVGDLLD